MTEKQAATTKTDGKPDKRRTEEAVEERPSRDELLAGVRAALNTAEGDEDFAANSSSEIALVMFRLGRVHGILSQLVTVSEAGQPKAE